MTGSATRVFAVVTPRGWTGSRCRAPKDETEPGVQALTATFHSRVRCRRWRTKWFLALSCFSVLRCSFAGVPDINPGASRALRAESHRKHAPPALRQLRIQALSNQHKVVSPIASDGSQILGTSLESPRARKARSRIRRRLPRRRKPVLSRHMREGGDDSRIACKVCLADVQLKCSEGSSTGVLKCPQCCDLIHERCMVPILEQNSAPSCPSCRLNRLCCCQTEWTRTPHRSGSVPRACERICSEVCGAQIRGAAGRCRRSGSSRSAGGTRHSAALPARAHCGKAMGKVWG
eukprot:2759425-Rhodomonas_salina.1